MNYLRTKLRKFGEVKIGILILGIGFILGLLFAVVGKGLYWNQINIIDDEYVTKIRETVFQHNVLLKYVLWNNLKVFLLFWILCSTALGIPYIVLSLTYGGFKIGLFITVIMMRYGVKGILLLFAYTFPQFLIYLPVAFVSLRAGYWLCKSMYHETRLGTKGKMERIIKHLGLIFILGIILILGCLMETYIGSFILQKILYLF